MACVKNETGSCEYICIQSLSTLPQLQLSEITSQLNTNFSVLPHNTSYGFSLEEDIIHSSSPEVPPDINIEEQHEPLACIEELEEDTPSVRVQVCKLAEYITARKARDGFTKQYKVCGILTVCDNVQKSMSGHTKVSHYISFGNRAHRY